MKREELEAALEVLRDCFEERAKEAQDHAVGELSAIEARLNATEADVKTLQAQLSDLESTVDLQKQALKLCKQLSEQIAEPGESDHPKPTMRVGLWWVVIDAAERSITRQGNARILTAEGTLTRAPILFETEQDARRFATNHGYPIDRTESHIQGTDRKLGRSSDH